MRMLFALPVAVLFGCAHQSSQTAEATAPQPVSQPVAAAPAAQPAMPQPIAGADPASSPNTCGLVRVKFDTDKAELHDADKALLTSTADCLKTNQQLHVNIEGNADERGTPEHNKVLSEERSKVVSDFLKEQGVSAEQIQQLSFGEDNPRCTESTEACWQKNRRTAIRPTCRM